MTTIILTQASNLDTSVLGVLGRQSTCCHPSCQPVWPQPYRYVTQAYRKKFDTYTSIQHPEIHTHTQISRCVARCQPKRKYEKAPIRTTNASKTHQICRPYKSLTQKQIKLRIERQTLRDLRNRIRTPPRATRVNYEALDLVQHDYLEDAACVDKTTQLNCPHLKFEEPEKPKKIGFDQSTQVDSDDLGSWDDGVTNLIEVITGKITQQCLLELEHEEELHGLGVEYRRREEAREEQREGDQSFVQEDEKLQRELEVVLEMQREKKQIMDGLTASVGAAVTGEKFVRDLLPAVLHDLHQAGVHVSEVVEEIQDAFTRELTRQIGRELDGPETEILMHLIQDEIQNRYDVYTQPETNERQFDPMQEEEGEGEEVEEEELDAPKEKKVQIDPNIEIMMGNINN